MMNEVKKVTLNDHELATQCRNIISKLCSTGGQSWKLSVPVDFNQDPDILFSELINRFTQSKKVEANCPNCAHVLNNHMTDSPCHECLPSSRPNFKVKK